VDVTVGPFLGLADVEDESAVGVKSVTYPLRLKMQDGGEQSTVAVSAFGAGPAFTSVGLVYLIGSMVSSVAPTPGGIGAVEATLIAGLTSAGMASTSAVAAVILFRLATFWIPLLPGWGALVVLQRSGDL
jgi:hypothetical protein